MLKHNSRDASSGLLVVVTLAFAACSDSPAGPAGPDRTFESATLTPAAANVNSARIDVEATGYDSVAFNMRTPGEPDQRSAAYTFIDGTAVGSALGLLADHAYAIDVIAYSAAGPDTVDTIAHSTGPLPAWLPQITTTGTPAADGFIGLAHPQGPVIVDNQGRVRWYLFASDPTLINFMAHPSGEYTLFGTQDAPAEFRVLDERGDVTRTLACVGLDTRFHEVRVMPNGDYWLTCNDFVQMDLTSRGGQDSVNVVWTTVQKVSAEGSLLAEFRTRDLFSLDDIDQDMIPGALDLNITHGNAIEFDTDGNLLLSWRSLNEISKFDVGTGEVLWRLGGNANSFTINDPTRTFMRQHGLRLVEPGVIQFLDNGLVSPSRVVRYRIDEQTMTADITLDYIDPTNAFTQVGGSTEVVGTDRRALVSFGRSGRVIEIDAWGTATFELQGITDLYIFRAFRIPSLYASERRSP